MYKKRYIHFSTSEKYDPVTFFKQILWKSSLAVSILARVIFLKNLQADMMI